MCGSLSEAVVGEDTSVDGTEILEQLEQRNLFVIPLDSERKWYRYHHLFGELLRHHLNRKESHRVSEYHRRAAKWYEQNGWIAEAIGHAIALMEQALQQLPQEASWLRATIVLNLGVTYFVADNFEPAQGVLAEVSQIGQTKGIATPAIAELYLQAQFHALRGRMDKAIALCQH